MLKLSQKVRKELARTFNDPQVVSVAIAANGEVLMAIDFNRYGLCETGIYRLTESTALEPLYIFKKSPRIWNRDICMKQLAKKNGAQLIENQAEMDEYLKRQGEAA